MSNADPAPALAAGRVCVLPHHRDPQRPRRTRDNSSVCNGHAYGLQRNLAELPGLWADLALMLRPAGRQLIGKISGQGETPTFVSGPVVEVRDLIVAALASWSRVVVEDRCLSGPASVEPHVTAPFLVAHCAWLWEQSFVDVVCAEIGELSSRAFSLAYPSGVRRIMLGECPTEGCGGLISARVRPTFGSEYHGASDSTVECDSCDLVVSPANQGWLRLGEQIQCRVA